MKRSPEHVKPAIAPSATSHVPECKSDDDHEPRTWANGSGWVPIHRVKGPWGPCLTPLVGRREFIAEIREAMMAGWRVVTIVGPPGAGRTRVVAEHCVREGIESGYRTYYFDCSDVADSDEMLTGIETALGIVSTGNDEGRRAARIGDVLADAEQAFLFLDRLDNSESLSPFLQGWLLKAPSLCVISTARRALHLCGELALELGPLSAQDARELFITAAAQARAHLGAHPEARTAIDEIVEQLDYLPLAIELCASRVGMLSLTDIAARLAENRFQLLQRPQALSTEHHRTLEACMDAAWECLSLWQRRLLQECAAFEGNFTLAAAESVLRTDTDAPPLLDALQVLRECSMLRVASSPTSTSQRFAMSRTVREYARLKTPPGHRLAVERRHTLFFARQAQEALLRDPYVITAKTTAEVLDEYEDLRAVVYRERHRGSLLAVRVGIPLISALTTSGHISAATEIVATMLDINEDDYSHELRARLLYVCSEPLLRHADMKLAQACATRGIEAARACQMPRWQALNLVVAAKGSCASGKLDFAAQQIKRAHTLIEGLEDDLVNARVHLASARIALAMRDLQRAQQHAARAGALYRRLDATAEQAQTLTLFARCRLEEGDGAGARRMVDKARACSQKATDQTGEAAATCLHGLLRLDDGDFAEAAQHFDAAATGQMAMGDRFASAYSRLYQTLSQLCSGRLGTAEENMSRLLSLVRNVDVAPLTWRTQLLVASTMYVTNRYADAEEAMTLARRAAPEDSHTREVLSLAGALASVAAAFRAFRKSDALHASHSLNAAADILAGTGVAKPERPDDSCHIPLELRVVRRLVRTNLDGLAKQLRAMEEHAHAGKAPLVIGPNAQWFQAPTGDRVNIHRRRSLRLLLLGLVQRHRTCPNRGLTTKELFEIGWPREHPDPDSAASRLWVALSTLRRLGLRDIVVRREDGYLIDPAISIRQQVD